MISEKYQSMIDTIVAKSDYLTSRTKDSIEATGRTMNNKEATTYYTRLNNYEKTTQNKLQKELNEEQQAFNLAVANGDIKKGSEEYNEMLQQIYATKQAIQESKNTVKENTLALEKIKWDNFDYALSKISNSIDNNDFLVDLMKAQGKLYGEGDDDDAGSIRDTGRAALAAMLANMNNNKALLDATNKEIEQFKKDHAEELAAEAETGGETTDRLNTLISNAESYSTSYYDYRSQIVSLMEEIYNAMISHLQELVNNTKESLQNQKDLYDYQKSINEKNEAISDTQKQLNALEGDTSEEAMKNRVQLEEQLKDQQEDLQDTEYEKWLSDQNDMLDQVVEDMQDWVDDKLDMDNVESLISEVTSQSITNSDNIIKALEASLSAAGLGDYDLLDNIKLDQIRTSGSDEDKALLSSIENLGYSGSELYDEYVKAKENGGTLPEAKESDTDYDKEAKSKLQGNGKVDKGDTVDYDGKSSPSANPSKDEKKKIKLKTGDDATVTEIKRKNATYPYHLKKNGKDLGWFKKGGLLKGYKTGGRDIEDEFAWTNENQDAELIRRSDGAILTPLGNGSGSMVFNNAMSDTLYDFAKNPMEFLEGMNQSATTVTPLNNVATNVNNDMSINLTLPGVTNYNDFVSKLKSDNSFEKFMQQSVLGAAIGKNSLLTKRY